eukprot:1622065-Prymnesium_polylepis.1
MFRDRFTITSRGVHTHSQCARRAIPCADSRPGECSLDLSIDDLVSTILALTGRCEVDFPSITRPFLPSRGAAQRRPQSAGK